MGTTDGGDTAMVSINYPDGSRDEIEVTVIGEADQDQVEAATWLTNETNGYDPVVDADRYVPRAKRSEPAVWYSELDASDYIDQTNLPEGTKFTFVPRPQEIQTGKHPETVVVTYPDGSSEKVSVTTHIQETQNNLNDPKPVTTPIEVKEGGVGYPPARDAITNADEMPSGAVTIAGSEKFRQDETEYVWVLKPADVGDNQVAQVSVNYPDGSYELVNVPVNVKPVPKKGTQGQQYADKFEPKTVEAIKINEGARNYPDPAAVITNKNDLPAGTTYEWIEKPTADGGDRALISVNYPDGTRDIVEVGVNGMEFIVPETPARVTADDYAPKAKNVQPVEKNSTPKPEDFVDTTGLPDGTRYNFAPGFSAPEDTATGGKKSATVVVTYPDGSVDQVEVVIPVKDDSDSYNPTPKPADQVAPIESVRLFVCGGLVYK